ncbi:hypothetical protein [Martelella sp. HB161492]|uniref:hypothetical protein n=1 Tax=Martelella sp. HB161492 TaxID=2720726 RepID=UPI001591A6F1|nr:hypothetical protein [Martelella sp. HB161492]
MPATKQNFFKPDSKATTGDKAATTDQIAREIIADEAAKRIQKTERLRNLRQQHEAAHTEAGPTAPAKKQRKTARKASSTVK